MWCVYLPFIMRLVVVKRVEINFLNSQNKIVGSFQGRWAKTQSLFSLPLVNSCFSVKGRLILMMSGTMAIGLTETYPGFKAGWHSSGMPIFFRHKRLSLMSNTNRRCQKNVVCFLATHLSGNTNSFFKYHKGVGALVSWWTMRRDDCEKISQTSCTELRYERHWLAPRIASNFSFRVWILNSWSPTQKRHLNLQHYDMAN